MSSVPRSSLITPFSKQRTNVMPDSGNTSKIKKLKLMIEQLEKEKKEYIITNQHLTQNTESICQQNKVLKDAINDRVIHYEHILDQYSLSTKTLQTATDNNRKMSKVYHGYKNRVSNVKKINDDSISCNEEFEKFDQEIKDIQQTANQLIKKFHESEKNIFDYKILFSLDSRLTNINRMMTKEAKNCLSTNPSYFNSLRLDKLQQKVEKGDQIKKELSLFDNKNEKEKVEATENALKIFSEKLDRCISIYNQIVHINKKRYLMNKEDLDISSDSTESSKSNSRKKERNSFEKVESRVPKTFSLNDEISELRRIVGTGGFGYLDDREREENIRKIQSHLIPINPSICDYEESTESDESEKENCTEKLQNSGDEKDSEKEDHSISIEDLQPFVEHPENAKNFDNSEKVDNSESDHIEKVNSYVKNDLSEIENKPEKEETVKDNNSEIEKEESLLPTKTEELSETSNNIDHSEKPDKIEKPEKPVKIKQQEQPGKIEQPKRPNKNKQPEKPVKIEQPEKPDKIEQSEKTDKIEQPEKPDKIEQPEKPDKIEQPGKPDKIEQPEKPEKIEHHEKPDKIKQQEKSDEIEQLEEDEIIENPEKDNSAQLSDNSSLAHRNKKQHSKKRHSQKNNKKEDHMLKNQLENKATNTEINTKLNNPKKEEPPQSTTNLPYSLLVHPVKNRQKTDKKIIKETKEENSSEYLLKSSEKMSEVETNTEIVTQPDKQEQCEEQNQPKKEEPTKPSTDKPYSLLVHPVKNRQKTDKKITKETKEENSSEYLLKSSEKMSETETNTEIVTQPEKKEPCEKQNQPKKEEPTKPSTYKPYSLLVHPIRNRKQDKKITKETKEDEILSEYVLKSSEGHSEIETSTAISIHSEQPEQHEEQKQPKKEESTKSSTEKPYSLLVHPIKNRKQDKKIIKETKEEDDITSEYVLKSSEGFQEIELSTETSSQPEKQEPFKEQKQPVKEEPIKSSTEKPYSLLVHPIKNKKQDKNVTKETKEEDDITSEYVLKSSEGFPEIELSTETSYPPEKQEPFKDQNQPVKEEPTKPTAEKPYSLLVHPIRNRKQDKNIIRETKEEEISSEYVLKSSEGFPEIESSTAISINSEQPEQHEEQKQPEKEEPTKSSTDKPYSLLVHPIKRNQLEIKYNQKQTEESEITSEYILDEFKDDQSEKDFSTEKFNPSDDQKQINIQPKPTINKESPNPSVQKPYSLLVHPNKNKKQTLTQRNQKQTEESEIASEYILDELEGIEDDQSEKDFDTDEFNLSNDQTQKNKQSKQTENKELSNPSIQKPYSLLVHPNKSKKQTLTQRNQKQTEESEIASEYILDSQIEQSLESNKSENLELSSSSEKSIQSDTNPNMKPTVKSPYSLLVHPNKSRQQTFNKNNQKSADESEIASEFILDDLNEQTFLSSTSEHPEIDNKLEQTENIKQTKPKGKSPYSLLVYPNKNRQQTITQQNQKFTDESEITSEYVLDEFGNDQSEKDFNTDKFNLSNGQTQKNKETKPTENIESPNPSIQKPYSLLVHPNKSKKQTLTQRNQKLTEESEIASEFILDSQIEQSLESNKSENLELSSSSEKSIQSDTNPNMKPTVKSPYSLLVHPNKNKKQTLTQHNQKSYEESEIASEYILDKSEEFEDEESEKAIVTNKFYLSNDQKQTNKQSKPTKNKESPNQSIQKPYSLLVHPNKIKQQTSTQRNQKQTEESEIASEYILEDLVEQSMQSDKSEDQELSNSSENPLYSSQSSTDTKLKANTPYSLLVHPTKNKKQSFVQNDQRFFDESEIVSEYLLEGLGEQSMQSNKSEDLELASSSEKSLYSSQSSTSSKIKPTVKAPYSLLVHPNKSRQQKLTKNIQKSADESEIASEYILDETHDEDSEKAISTEKFILTNSQTQQFIKTKQTENIKSSKQSNNPNSLLVHPNKNKQQTFVQNNQKSTDEFEFTSEYVLGGTDNEQSEQSISTEKFVLPNSQTKQTENIKSSKQSNNNPNSLLVHPNKNKQQTFIQNNQKSADELEFTSEYVLGGTDNEQSDKETKTEKYLLPNTQTQQNIKTKQTEKIESSNASTQKTYSLLVHPNKNRQKALTKYDQKNKEDSEQASEFILEELEDFEDLEEQLEEDLEKEKITYKLAQLGSPRPTVKAPYSLLVHPNKSRQQKFIQNNQKSSDELELTSEYVLDGSEEDQSEKATVTEKYLLPNTQSQQNIKTKQTENKESSNPTVKAPCSLLVHPNKSRKQTPIKSNQKSSDELEQSSEFMLNGSEEDQSEKAIVTEKYLLPNTQIEQNIGEKETENIESLKLPPNSSCSLLVHPNKSRQQTPIKSNQKSSDELEQSSEFVLNESEEDQSEKATVTEKYLLPNTNSNQNTELNEADEIIEPMLPIKKSFSLLVHPNKNNQKSISIPYQKVNEEDDFCSEFRLEEQDLEQQETTKKETERLEPQTNKKKNKKAQKKKQPFISSYDPSIFYSSLKNVSEEMLDFEEIPDPVLLTVSLKDIGLEGLDSSNLEKMKELQRLKQIKENEKNNKKGFLVRVGEIGDKNLENNTKSDVLCRMILYETKDKIVSSKKKMEKISPSTTLHSSSDEQSSDGLSQKPASLLDSTQKAQKTQAIKPKKMTKNGSKMNKKSQCNNGSQTNSRVYRSPRKFNVVNE